MNPAGQFVPTLGQRGDDVSPPALWSVLALPVGVHAGFVRLALTFSANSHGLSIQDGGWILGAHLVSQWLKWLWAPAVDLLWTPRHWYLSGVVASLGSFPVWWTGLALAAVADRTGPVVRLWADASLGLAGVALFAWIAVRARRGA